MPETDDLPPVRPLLLSAREKDTVEAALILYREISEGNLNALYDVLERHNDLSLAPPMVAEKILNRATLELGARLPSRERRTAPPENQDSRHPVCITLLERLKQLPIGE